MKAKLFVKNPDKFMQQFLSMIGQTVFDLCEPKAVNGNIIISIPEDHRVPVLEAANKLSLLVKPMNSEYSR